MTVKISSSLYINYTVAKGALLKISGCDRYIMAEGGVKVSPRLLHSASSFNHPCLAPTN